MAALPVRRSGRNLTVVNSTRECEDLYDRMGQLVNFAFGLTPAALADMPWVPLTDLSETDDAYVVKAELPGVHKDQVNVQLQDREQLITGEIAGPENGKGSRHHSSRRTGRFELRTDLPADVKADAITAQLSDGHPDGHRTEVRGRQAADGEIKPDAPAAQPGGHPVQQVGCRHSRWQQPWLPADR
jgi:HSP20 family protein